MSCHWGVGSRFYQNFYCFSTGGATPEDVRLLRENSPASLKIKAAGGIASLQDAEILIACGADRLGSSRLVKLAQVASDGDFLLLHENNTEEEKE